jgi:hypothetical protein
METKRKSLQLAAKWLENKYQLNSRLCESVTRVGARNDAFIITSGTFYSNIPMAYWCRDAAQSFQSTA